MPLFIKHWVINFLINRPQVKVADILSGVPQGTKLRPWLFLLVINDLWSPQVQTWKYIDDTTISEVMPKCSTTNIHDAVDNIQTWSTTDRLQLNVAKYKELVISFSKTVNNFPSLNIDSGQLEVVMNARILGLTISNNLKWNDHMANIIKKANKPLYFIVKMHQSPWTRHYYLLCDLCKTCFGVQLSGFPFCITSLLIRCHRMGSEACSGNHLPQHRLHRQLGPQWNFKAKGQAFKSIWQTIQWHCYYTQSQPWKSSTRKTHSKI